MTEQTEVVEQPRAKRAPAPRTKREPAPRAIKATGGTVSIAGKMLIKNEPVEIDAKMLKDAWFMKHIEYGVKCNILAWVN